MAAVSFHDLGPGPEALSWVDRRAAAAARTWTPAQRTHPGDVAWGRAQQDGALGRVRIWTDSRGDVCAWAIIEPVAGRMAYADLHVDPRHLRGSSDLRREVVEFACSQAEVTLMTLLDRERCLQDLVVGRGGVEEAGPWFSHMLTDFTDLAAPRLRPLLPEEYRIRPVTDADVVGRVEVHRRAWAPARITALHGAEPGPDQVGEESTFDAAAYERVRETAIYRPELDLVVEAPDGALAASALGWFDEVSASGLIEPVGTDPAYAARGLARAACAQLLRELGRLGARVALVCPRGDEQYPIPLRLYRSLGMRPVARTRTFRIGSAG